MGRGTAEGRGGNEAGRQLMNREPLTLEQIGLMLAQKSKSVGKEKRASFQEVMRLLRTPVGGLKTRRGN